MRFSTPHAVAGLIGLLLLGSVSAQAAITTYSFSGTLDSGVFQDETFSGQFSFDDAALAGAGDEYLAVDTLTMSFHGGVYTHVDAAATPEAAFTEGALLGLSFTVESSDPAFSLIPGFSSAADAYFGYDPSAGDSGFGSVTYTLVPVPEPKSYAMLLAGLGLIGYVVRKRV